VRGKYGWTVKRELADGERWIAADGRLWLRRADGTLEKNRYVARWAIRGSDWRRLLDAYAEDPRSAIR